MSTLLIDLEGHELKQEEVELLEHPLVAGLILFTMFFLISSLILGSRTFLNRFGDRKSTRLNSSHSGESRMPSSA